MAFSFVGKKILVTGAGKGIGRAIAVSLTKAGGKVYALSRTQSTLDTLVAEYPDIVPIIHDLKDWDKTRAVLADIEPLDGLVNNAAIGHSPGPSLDCTKAILDETMQVNVFGVINCIQMVAKKMVDSGRPGSIVNISSVSSAMALGHALDYNVSKAAVDMVTKQFALELGPHNIRVNSVNPTFVLTGEFVPTVEMMAPITERTPMSGYPTAQDIASTVMYFLSDSSAMVTGTTHFVDGGLTCNITTKQ